jgi:hypothetical protein
MRLKPFGFLESGDDVEKVTDDGFRAQVATYDF